jgi:oligogalacturonide transporter
VALFIPMCMRYHPAPSYRIAVGLFAAGTLGLLALYRIAPSDDSDWIYLPVLLAGLGRGGLNYIPWNVYNYMADVDEIVTGRRREGAFAGVMTFIRKTTQAGAVIGVGLILQAGGFVSGSTTQKPQAVTTILVVLLAGTLLLLTLGYIVSLRFKLDRNTHAVLMAEIQRFKREPDTRPTPYNRLIVENLSGWPYEQLWGRVAAQTPAAGTQDASRPA